MLAQHNTGLAISGRKVQFAPVKELIVLMVGQTLPYRRKSLRLAVNQELVGKRQSSDVDCSYCLTS